MLSARRIYLTALLGATIAFAGAPGTAAAAKTVVRPATFGFEARLPTTNGFAIFLRAEDRRHVRLEIESRGGGGGSLTTADYTTVGRVRRHRIDADFGRFGRVDLRFSGRPKRSVYPFRFCRGEKTEVEEYGAMEGTIDFEALGKIVNLHTDRVAYAQIREAPRRICTRHRSRVVHRETEEGAPAPQPLAEAEITSLLTVLARGHTMGRTIDFYVLDFEGEIDDAAATTTRRFGPALVETTVHAPQGPGEPGEDVELAINGKEPRPDGAQLSIGAPFSGSVTFAKRPGGSTTWLGSFAAKFPGEGTLPLAGPEFRSAICDYERTSPQRACEGAIAPPHLVG
jgi:hypothetical protein